MNNSSTLCIPEDVYVPIASVNVTMFALVAIPVVVLFGLIGNIISLIILKETANSISAHFYLSCVAVFDCLSLCTILITMWAGVVVPGFQWHFCWTSNALTAFMKGHWSCQIRLYVTFTCRTLSMWTIVILSIERCLCIIKPLKFRSLNSTKTSKIIIITLIVASLPTSFYSFFAFDNKVIPVGKKGFKNICVSNQVFFAGRIYQLLILSVLPWSIMTISNVLIIIQLKKRSQNMYLTSCASGKETDSGVDTGVIKRLLSVSIACIILTFPLMIISSIHSHYEFNEINSHKRGILADIYIISLILFAVNFACNFILYCFTGHHFRRAAIALIRGDFKKMHEARSQLDPRRSKRTYSEQTGRSDLISSSVVTSSKSVRNMNNENKEVLKLENVTSCNKS